MRLYLKVIPGVFSIHRLAPDAAVPEAILASGFFSVTRTDEELSILCREDLPVDSPRREGGWACIKVAGPLDFSLTGIMARLAGLLAGAGISLFAVSTFDTDYLLVRGDQLALAVEALESGGCRFPSTNGETPCTKPSGSSAG